MATKEFNPLEFGATPVQETTSKPQKSFGEKLFGGATAVSDFLGGKGITDYFGSKIAKAT